MYRADFGRLCFCSMWWRVTGESLYMKFIQSKRARKASFAAIAAMSSLLTSGAHGAVVYSWAAAAAGNWNDATKWTPNTGSPVAGDTAIFNAVGADGADTVYL